MFPSPYISQRMAKAGVSFINKESLTLKCSKDGQTWQAQPPLKQGWWKCPNGCSDKK